MNTDEIKRMLNESTNSAEFMSNCLGKKVKVEPIGASEFNELRDDQRLSLVAKVNTEKESINVFSLSTNSTSVNCYEVEILHLIAHPRSPIREYFHIGE